MTFEELHYDVNALVNSFLDGRPEVSAEEVGLDRRCGNIIIGEDFIAKYKSSDNLLQYYGGFEYVDKEMRFELGDYVFYLTDGSDCRVMAVIERFEENELA